jgi:hypothetical protein
MKHKPDYVALVQEYEQGKMKQREFCSKNRIKYSTFQFWLSKVRRQRVNAGRFLPVRVIEQERSMNNHHVIEICYPDGTALKLSQATPEMVKQFLPAFAS